MSEDRVPSPRYPGWGLWWGEVEASSVCSQIGYEERARCLRPGEEAVMDWQLGMEAVV